MDCRALAVAMLMLSLPLSSHAREIKVDAVNGPIFTIAAGIAAAGPDDEIIVLPGVYKERVVLPEGAVLVAPFGPLDTIIDGEGKLPEVVTISSDCYIEGFAVIGGADGGFAIGAREPVSDAIIAVCDTGTSATGISLPPGSNAVLIVNDLFYAHRGAAIAVDGAAGIEVFGATIHGCGAGIDAIGGSEIIIWNSIVADCAGPGIRDSADSIEEIYVGWSDIVGNQPDWSGLDAQIGRAGGTGNIAVDPLFVDPASGDFRPGTCSPVKDAGDPDPMFEDCPVDDVLTRSEIGAFCAETEGGPPRDLACAASPEGNDLTWTSAELYQAILIERDGERIANIAGSLMSFRDTDPPLAAVYRVVGVSGARICPSVPCGVARYRVRTSDADPGAAYEWIDIEPAPTLPPVNEFVSEPIPLGFPFPFMGAPRTEVRIAVDGYLLFNPSDPPPAEPAPIPSPEEPNLLVAAYGSDLSTDLELGSGRVRYATRGDPGSRVFVVEWDGVTHPRPPGEEELPESFQVRLREDSGRIEIAYRETSTGGGRHPARPADGVTIGIEAAGGLAGVSLGFTRPGLVRNSLQVVFEPFGAQVEPIFLRGDVSGDGQMQLNDPILLLSFLFSSGAAPICPDAADIDDSGSFTIGDAVWDLNYLFASGAPPADPGALACGVDPTVDALGPCGYPRASCPAGGR